MIVQGLIQFEMRLLNGITAARVEFIKDELYIRSFINVTGFYVFLGGKNLLSSSFTKGKQREKQAYVLLQ